MQQVREGKHETKLLLKTITDLSYLLLKMQFSISKTSTGSAHGSHEREIFLFYVKTQSADARVSKKGIIALGNLY